MKWQPSWGVTRMTVYKWIQDLDKQEFADRMRFGVQLAKAWWDRQGRRLDENINASLWKMNMSKRYAWVENAGVGENRFAGQQEEVSSVRETVDVEAIIQAVEREASHIEVEEVEPDVPAEPTARAEPRAEPPLPKPLRA